MLPSSGLPSPALKPSPPASSSPSPCCRTSAWRIQIEKATHMGGFFVGTHRLPERRADDGPQKLKLFFCAAL